MAIGGLDDKPCTVCSFWDGQRCTHTWRLIFHIEPLGGQMEFSTTPGMVPEHLKPELDKFMEKFMEKMAPAIRMWPIWEPILEWQLAHPDREACPGREVRKDIPHLKVVKADDLRFSFEKECPGDNPGCGCKGGS